jgi:hypothetical protein
MEETPIPVGPSNLKDRWRAKALGAAFAASHDCRSGFLRASFYADSLSGSACAFTFEARIPG